jgi:hypothetical protein
MTQFDTKWKAESDKQIRKALGEDAWRKIMENERKSRTSYPLTVSAVPRDILEFTYLGQLVQLMIWNESWSLFKHLFRDKRQLEDMLREISPVRNDRAHFRSVPERELSRCKLRCEDFLAILDTEERPQNQPSLLGQVVV